MIVHEQFPMREKSNMRIGGIADRYIEIEAREELPAVYEKYDRIFLLGNGTNTLFYDGPLRYTFVSVKKTGGIVDLGKGLVRVGAGADFKDVIRFMREKDYSGLENLAGIPGSVGGLTWMNGGAYGSWIFDCVDEVEIFDENHAFRKLKGHEIKSSYRHTEIQEKNWVILSVTFRFRRGFDLARVREIQATREEKQPLNYPSLGSTFKNPENDFAARLVAEAGLKGTVRGGAQISEKHPNFIINLGNATFSDVTGLMALMRDGVREKFGITLKEEIIVLT
ncbi:MAG: UDP-N-acetylmuramate dehydrogenase [Fusobacteriaceae bacterium]|jgi:UDP-N-acetylmuramate dehydrogenase|nr:UDP-N-acetylmuramate dehydrogenase [Fusobacteriaceae bacterium]